MLKTDFYGGTEHEQKKTALQNEVNAAIAQIQKTNEDAKRPRYVQTPHDEDELQLRDPDIAMTYLKEAFLTPLQNAGKPTHDLLEVKIIGGKQVLSIKSKWREKIKVNAGTPLSFVMTHYNDYVTPSGNIINQEFVFGCTWAR